MSVRPHDHIHGEVSPGFEAVREEFIRNFEERGELGGACCAYFQGKPVVDIWGGVRDVAEVVIERAGDSLGPPGPAPSGVG